MIDYQPFKIQPTSKAKNVKEASSSFTFPGQFTSTTAKDYGGMQPEKICPCTKLESPPDFMKSTTYFNPAEKLYYV